MEKKTPDISGLQKASAIPQKTEHVLPTFQDLISDVEVAGKSEALNSLLMALPPEKWLKKHPFISNYIYLPIDKVEYLLRKIFKTYRIEVLREGTAFNGVYVVVRVHYMNPATGEMEFHDGIGAQQLQTKSGTSPADLLNINSGAISMAFPIAKTMAVKDACDHFGKLFGCDLNRKDTLEFKPDTDLIESSQVYELKKLYVTAKLTDEEKKDALRIIDGNETASFPKLLKLLNSKQTQS
jgi:hypothetical protein